MIFTYSECKQYDPEKIPLFGPKTNVTEISPMKKILNYIKLSPLSDKQTTLGISFGILILKTSWFLTQTLRLRGKAT